MTDYLPPLDQRPGAGEGTLLRRISYLEQRLNQLVTGAVQCLSTSHPANPAVGTQILETDTGAVGTWNGTAWQFAPTPIGTVTVTGSSVANITIAVPAGFSALSCIWNARSAQAAVVVNMGLRFNGDTSNSYLWQEFQVENATSSAANSGGVSSYIQIGVAPAASATASYFGTGSFTVTNPSSSVFKSAVGVSYATDSTTDQFVGPYGGQWANTGAITSVTLVATAGNLVVGSMLSITGYK